MRAGAAGTGSRPGSRSLPVNDQFSNDVDPRKSTDSFDPTHQSCAEPLAGPSVFAIGALRQRCRTDRHGRPEGGPAGSAAVERALTALPAVNLAALDAAIVIGAPV